MKKLYIVDPQNDFMDYGTLPVAGSVVRMHALAEYLNGLETDEYEQILVSLDWHPLNHCSFAAQGGPWPQHCVSYTQGALVMSEVEKALERWRMAGKVTFITKGCKVKYEEYSGVDDPFNAAVVHEELKGTTQLDVCGVVGTVCVQNTLKGLIEKEIIGAEKITVLPRYTAQFDEASEAAFLQWVDEQGISIKA